MDLAFKDLGQSDATRMPLLILYVHDEPLRQKDLADALHLDSSSLVRVLAHLREAELVDWACNPADRRTKYITLTPSGRKMAKLILAKSMEIEHAILQGHSPQELDVTRRVLESISRRFSELGS
ncbi:MarR family transcriptional regulator [Pusillimonas sp. TS35]|nr:MarR family transcriptional regulator [Pusillimonas sp. TS35]